MSDITKEQIITAEAHHDGWKTKGQAAVWGVDTADEITLSVRSKQGYAPGARGYSCGGVVNFSAAEARELAAALLAAAEQAERLDA